MPLEAICEDQVGGVVNDPPYTPDDGYAPDFQGELGEHVLGVMGARKNVQGAFMDWSDAQKLYHTSAQACLHRSSGSPSVVAVVAETHDGFMQELNAAGDSQRSGSRSGRHCSLVIRLVSRRARRLRVW